MSHFAKDPAPSFWKSSAGLTLLVAAMVGGFYLVTEHRAHLFGWLMAEHIKTMQDGIPMMNGMPSDISMHQQMMEKRIEMMGASMQMMMDRLPPVPAN